MDSLHVKDFSGLRKGYCITFVSLPTIFEQIFIFLKRKLFLNEKDHSLHFPKSGDEEKRGRVPFLILYRLYQSHIMDNGNLSYL